MTGTREKEIHLLDYWRVLVKRRWVVHTSVLVVFATVTLGSLVTQPVYTATARLQIERSAPNVLPFQQVVASVPDNLNDFHQTQHGLIQSRRVAREVVAALNLAGHPEFRGAARGGEGGPEAAEARLIDAFLGKLKVAPVRNSRLVDVSFSSTDRGLAARAANKVAETYIAFNSEAQYNTTERATASLALQIANLSEEIDRREQELQEYARRHGIIALNEKQDITLKRLNDLSNACTSAQAVRIEREARYAALLEADPDAIPEVADSRLVQELAAKSAELARRHAQLSEKYMPGWPEMARLRREMEETERRLEGERRAIHGQALAAAESAYRASLNEEVYLQAVLERLKREAQEMGLKEIEYNNLKSGVANRRATLEALVKRQTETSTSAGLNDVASSNVRVVDQAETPLRPSSPKVRLNMALGLLAGLGLGVGLAFFFEYLDKSIKTTEEFQAASGAPVIGFIPLMRGDGGRLRLVRGNGGFSDGLQERIDLISHQDPKAKASEAFREMRTAFLVSRPGGPPRTVLVTSSQPAEGKTVVAVNLAVSLAQIGRRVLLVDADLRKPRLHRVFHLPNDRGLSSDLSGRDAIDPRVLPTSVAGLSVLPSGPIPPNPADLLDSERFTHLAELLLAAGFDHVVVDSPPVLAVADPGIMAGRMEAVVMVARIGDTGRDALGHAARKLAQVNAKIVGGVLNRIDVDQQSYYGGYYYGKRYQKYYGEPEPAPEAVAPAGRAAAAGPG
jgi:capsular exopolysaccharide synthesis family protein